MDHFVTAAISHKEWNVKNVKRMGTKDWATGPDHISTLQIPAVTEKASSDEIIHKMQTRLTNPSQVRPGEDSPGFSSQSERPESS